VSCPSRGRALIAGSLLASLALVLIYLLAGGASYEPVQVRDPCAPREWRSPQDLQEIAQQFSLSALDGAACELQVTRETLARALVTEASRERFARRYGIGDAELEAAVRAGLVRAVDDAADAGALNPLLAVPLREVAKRLPIDEAIAALRDARRFLEDAQGLLGQAGGLLGDLLR
jgi:hypothetical protein